MDYMALSERRLRYFLEAATAGSIRAAADRLNVEPSVISRQIQQLEHELGVQLLERRGRGVAPTEAAEIVLEHCRERRASEAMLFTKLGELAGLQRGEIHIVAGEGFIGDIVQWVLNQFCQQFPKIRLSVHYTDASKIVQMIALDQAHIGLAFGAPADPAIRVVKSRAQPICIIAAPGHPLARRRGRIPLTDVLPYPLGLMSAGFGLHHMLYRAAAVDGVELVPTLTSNSIGTLKHYAATGLGITFLSTHAVSEEVAAGKLVALRTSNDVLESVEAQLIVRAGRHVPMAASRLLSLLQATSAFGIRTSK